MKAIRTILACIRKADQTFNLIQHGDKIVIGLSGGKDSIALTYLLSLYQKFSHTDFVIQPVTLDLGFPGFEKEPLEKFCESIGLKLIVKDCQDVYKILSIQQENQKTKHLPCSICSRMKKAAINKVAQELGFNKVAFAHHGDDAIETLFMNEIHGGRIATFAPKMHLERADIDFIRPLILVRENDIIRMIKEENLPVFSSHCPSDKFTNREETKLLLKDIYHRYPTSKEAFLNMLTNFEQEDIWDKEIYYQINQDGLSLKPVTTIQDAIKMDQICNKAKVQIKMSENNDLHHYLICQNNDILGTISYKEDAANKTYEICYFVFEKNNIKIKEQVLLFLTNYIIGKYNPCLIISNIQSKDKEIYQSLDYQIEEINKKLIAKKVA